MPIPSPDVSVEWWNKCMVQIAHDKLAQRLALLLGSEMRASERGVLLAMLTLLLLVLTAKVCSTKLAGLMRT